MPLFRWGLEYADCLPPADGKTPSKKGCPGYDTKLLLIVKLQFWSSGKWGVPIHRHYFQVHSNPEL